MARLLDQQRGDDIIVECDGGVVYSARKGGDAGKRTSQCGMTIVWGLEAPNKWSGGSILDRNDHTIYRLSAVLKPDDMLHARIFKGIPMVGKTEIPTRVEPSIVCWAVPQRFMVQRDSLLGSVYPRYFGYYDRALAFYTHTADQHSVYATQVIACTPREAGYVLGGILDNDTVLPVREHISDTHGFTEHLFGLCTLLGIRFMPRLKDLPDQVLSRVDRAADYGPPQPVFRNTINLDLIIEQWDELVRLAASLKDRLTPAHVVMQRLVNAPAADRLAGALTQLGRLAKTIHSSLYS